MTFYTKYVAEARMRFFAISWMLDTLCGAHALDRLARLRSSLSDRRRETGLIKGYELVVETMLYRQIEFVVNVPDILRLQGDESLQLWWSNTDQKAPGRLKSFASSNAPDSVFVANHINDLLLRMVRSGNRWDRFVDASTIVRSYAATLLALAADCEVVFLHEEATDPVPDTRHVLRSGGVECLHDFVFEHPPTTLNAAWNYASAGVKEWLEPRTPAVHWMSDVETSRDSVATIAEGRRSVDDFTVIGIDAAIAIASGAPTRVDRAIAERDRVAPPEENLFGDLLREFQTGRWPSMRYGMSFNGELPQKAVRSLMSFEESSPDPRERLKDLLGDSAFLTAARAAAPNFTSKRSCEV